MSLRARIGAFFGIRGDAASDFALDPIAALDAQYVKAADALQDLRDAIASVFAQERRLERERTRAASEVADRLMSEVNALRGQRGDLEKTASDVASRLSEMRTQKTALIAQAAASRAATRASEATARVAENAYQVATLVDAARTRALELSAHAREVAGELGSPGERHWQPDPPERPPSGE